MIQTDYHLHSDFSTDSSTPMEEMIKQAVNSGLHTICFTDHMDYDFPSHYHKEDVNKPLFQFNPDTYFMVLNELKEKYRQSIDILKGIELGLKPDLKERYKKLTHQYPWDFVIGSIHLVDNIDPYYEDYWNRDDEESAILKFFEFTLDCIKQNLDYDVMGHIDYILRYAPSKNKNFSFSKYSSILDEIIKQLVAQGKGIEVNTSGLKAGLGVPNPCPEIISRYLELGGEMITIGSDAHNTQYLGFRFEETANLLKSLGVRYYTIFKNRKPELLSL